MTIPNGTYDNETTRQRESYFNGQITAVWHASHLDKMPWGTFPPMPRKCISCGSVEQWPQRLPCGH